MKYFQFKTMNNKAPILERGKIVAKQGGTRTLLSRGGKCVGSWEGAA